MPASAWRSRFAMALGTAASLAILARWLWLIAPQVPQTARSDHLVAIWRVSPAVERHDWLAVLAWMFELAGGHVIAYARALQLVNYVAFDYSGGFIRVAALACFALAWIALAWAVWRTLRPGLAAGATLVWGTWLACSPVLVNLLVWPESVPAFLFPIVVALLVLPWMRSLPALAGGGVAMALTNGTGWMFVPGFALAGSRRALWLLAFLGLLAGLAVFAVRIVGARQLAISVNALLAQADSHFLWQSLDAAASHPLLAAQTYLSLLAHAFWPARIGDNWPMGLALLGYFVLLYALRDREGDRRWLGLAFFGLLSCATVLAGRFVYTAAEGTSGVIPTHYSIVALPFHLALVPMAMGVAGSMRRPAQWLVAALGLMLACGVVSKRWTLDDRFDSSTRTELAARFGAANWNLFSGALLLGNLVRGQVSLLEVVPDLHAAGKYPELTRQHIADASALGRLARSAAAEPSCGTLHRLEADLRFDWHQPSATFRAVGKVPFTRAVGWADLGRPGIVFMTDAAGNALCAAHTGALATHFTEPQLRELPRMQSDSAFDFSCPGAPGRRVWAHLPETGKTCPVRISPAS